MKTADLEKLLVDWSVRNSGFEPGRNYIGLSGIGDCEQVIYDRLRTGQQSSAAEQLKTRISYELEGELINRLSEMGLYSKGETISLQGGLVQGHTDGVVDGRDLLEIKTLEREVYFPTSTRPSGNGIPSRRIQWQVQAYMHYTCKYWTHIVYLARDTGAIFCLGVKYDSLMGTKIESKVRRLASAVRRTERPECSCGRCSTEKAPVVVEKIPRIVNGEK